MSLQVKLALLFLLDFLLGVFIFLLPHGTLAKQNTLWIGLVLSATGVGLAAWLAGGLVRPLRRVADAAQKITEGNLDVRLEVRSKDELGPLADAFNRMATSLLDTIGALNRKVGEALTLYEINREINAQVAYEPTLDLIAEPRRRAVQRGGGRPDLDQPARVRDARGRHRRRAVGRGLAQGALQAGRRVQRPSLQGAGCRGDRDNPGLQMPSRAPGAFG